MGGGVEAVWGVGVWGGGCVVWGMSVPRGPFSHNQPLHTRYHIRAQNHEGQKIQENGSSSGEGHMVREGAGEEERGTWSGWGRRGGVRGWGVS